MSAVKPQAVTDLLTDLTTDRDAIQAQIDEIDRQIQQLTDQRTALKGDANETTNVIRALERHQEVQAGKRQNRSQGGGGDAPSETQPTDES